MSAKFKKPKFLKSFYKTKVITNVKKADLENLGDVRDFDSIHKKVSMHQDNYDVQRSMLVNANGYFTAKQVASLLNEIKASDNRLNLLKVVQKKLYAMTCQEAVPVVLIMNPRHVKLEALQLVLRFLLDPENFEDLHGAIPYEEDRKELAKLAAQAIKKNKPISAPTQRSAWASGRTSDNEETQTFTIKGPPSSSLNIAYMGSCAVKDNTEVVDLEEDGPTEGSKPSTSKPPTYNRSAPVESHFHQPFSPRKSNSHYDHSGPTELPGMML